MRTQKTAISSKGDKTSGDAKPIDAFILDFQPLRLKKINFCCLNHLVYVMFVMAALGNYY